jgi:ribosome-binding protein aMBF1 (putative translation factor)
MARTRNLADVIRAKLANNAKLAEAVEQEAFNADIAMKVYQARTEAGLTQEQLAARIGTRQSVISRIEDADYKGHSLRILKQIAGALDQNLRVEFCGQSQKASHTRRRRSSARKPLKASKSAR